MKKKKGFRIHFLPAYAPEYNPEEYLNRSVKAVAAEEAIPEDEAEAVAQTTENLRRHREDKEGIRRFFRHPKVRYAAEG